MIVFPKVKYARFKKRKIEVEFTGGGIPSAWGVMLLREVNKRLNLYSKSKWFELRLRK